MFHTIKCKPNLKVSINLHKLDKIRYNFYGDNMLKSSNDLKEKKIKIDKIITSLFLTIMLLSSVIYFGYNLIFNAYKVNQLFLIINSSIIVLEAIIFTISIISKKEKTRNIFNNLTMILMSIFAVFNLLVGLKIINLNSKSIMPDFTNKNINEAITWADKNKISYEQVYESSDNIEEFYIITQSVKADTPIHDIKKVTFYVSDGPNYEKEVIIPNMIGWKIDDAIDYIDKNFLNNVNIEYELNDNKEKDIIFEQSINGQIKRNTLINLKVSLGTEEDLVPVTMIDLKNNSLFKATLWLKRYGIKYNLSYDFSDSIKINNVISQDKEKDTTIDPKTDIVNLIISKGKKIIVPDFTKMKSNEIIKWITDNNLKVVYEEKYDASVEVGNVIESNYKAGDEIAEGTTIKLITSKGKLTLPSFDNLNSFRTWATENNISYTEEYEYNDTITKGEIIRFSIDTGSVVNSIDNIITYISNGKEITIPNFVGKTSNEITNTCKSLGLNCKFVYEYSSSIAKGKAINQNKKADSKVVEGTYVNITISNGPKPVSTNNSGQSNNNTTPNNNTNDNNQPTTPTLTCDKSKTVQIWLPSFDLGIQVKDAILKKYGDIKWNFNMVSSCPNGSTTRGTVCNAPEVNGEYLNYCDTYTLTIVE